MQILSLNTGVSLSVFLSKLLFNWDVIIGKNESSSKGYSMMSSLPFSPKKLTLIFGRYTGIRVYEDASICVRNNQFIFHWEGSDAR